MQVATLEVLNYTPPLIYLGKKKINEIERKFQ